MMRSFVLSIIFLLASASAYAQGAGGCSCCKAPGVMAPPHGGIMEHIKNHQYVELVADTGRIAVYLLDRDLETLPIDHITMTGKLRLPRQQKSPLSVEFKPQYGCFIANINLDERVHRYALELTIKSNTDIQKVKFQVEPGA